MLECKSLQYLSYHRSDSMSLPSMLCIKVEESGYVHCWKYKAETWTFMLTVDLCNVNQTTIVSICLHPSQNALFWCEKQQSGADDHDEPTYCIYKRQLPDGKIY